VKVGCPVENDKGANGLSAGPYKHNGASRVTEFAAVAFPFSFQLGQQILKRLLRVQRF
jgi:hypothetical protein